MPIFESSGIQPFRLHKRAAVAAAVGGEGGKFHAYMPAACKRGT